MNDISFDGSWMVTEISSFFKVLDHGDALVRYFPGNVHRFSLPDHAEEIGAKERVEKSSGPRAEDPAVPENDLSWDVSDDGSYVSVFPETRTFRDVQRLNVSLTFRKQVNLMPTDKTFGIPWKYNIDVRDYLGWLCKGEVRLELENINRLDFRFRPPTGCSWNTSDDARVRLHGKFSGESRGNPETFKISSEEIAIQFTSLRGHAHNLNLDLPLVRSSDEVRSYFDRMVNANDADS
ncbi:MAG: hypothetical protein H6963_01355 [Chromatiaceae bacterium]|nr:hypothetical protein [Gammaproteobacteria bacterium]MCP5407927.1 hypothetical protein [Chromatiaceae bacterium]